MNNIKLAVEGISLDQQNELLEFTGLNPIDEIHEDIDLGKLGDFGIGVLVFAGSIYTVRMILNWVSKQENVTVTLKILDLLEIKVDKNTKVDDVKKIARDNHIVLRDE